MSDPKSAVPVAIVCLANGLAPAVLVTMRHVGMLAHSVPVDEVPLKAPSEIAGCPGGNLGSPTVREREEMSSPSTLATHRHLGSIPT